MAIVEKTESNTIDEHKMFDAFFYGAESPLVIFRGPDLIIEKFNEKYQAIYPGRELLGVPLLIAVPELMESPFPNILKEVYETGQHFNLVEGLARIYNRAIHKLEDRYFDTAFSRINYEDNVFRVLATPREVTDKVLIRKKLEESLNELKAERELRERFVLALSHDLRTPLAVIKIGAQIVKRQAIELKAIANTVEKITTNVDRADRMIRDLLDANRINAGVGIPINVEECRLDSIINFVVTDLNQIYGQRFIIANNVGEVSGFWDNMALHRLIENLASNAIKYGSSDTNVTITLSLKNNKVEISVHNFGNPIELSEQNYLFKQFYRTDSADKSDTKGWGIGLALVKGITEAHGGEIRLESDKISGTNFIVQLPLDSRK